MNMSHASDSSPCRAYVRLRCSLKLLSAPAQWANTNTHSTAHAPDDRAVRVPLRRRARRGPKTLARRLGTRCFADRLFAALVSMTDTIPRVRLVRWAAGGALRWPLRPAATTSRTSDPWPPTYNITWGSIDDEPGQAATGEQTGSASKTPRRRALNRKKRQIFQYRRQILRQHALAGSVSRAAVSFQPTGSLSP